MCFAAEPQSPSRAYALWLLCAARLVMMIFGFDAQQWASSHYCLWWLNQRTGRSPLLYIAPTQSTSDITIMRTIAKHCLATLFLTHTNIGGLPISRTSVLSRVVHRRFCCVYCNNFLFVFGSVLYATSVVFHCSCCVYYAVFWRYEANQGVCSMWYFLRKNIAKNR